MKFFVLTLALAVLTGTWASVIRDEPDSKLERLVQLWEEDAENFTRTVQGKLALIERLRVSQEFTDVIRSIYDNMARRLINLQHELPAEFVEALNMFFQVPAIVVEKAVGALSALESHRGHNLEEAAKKWKSALEEYADPVLERVGPYAATLRSALISKTQEISFKLDEKIPQQMQTLGTQLEPYIKELQKSQASLEPYLDPAVQLIKKGVETFHKHLLKPYVAPILRLYQKYKNDFGEGP